MSKHNVLIDFNNVSKNYKKIKALDNISFKVYKGEVFGYIGPNGAGKTTTIKILVGLIRNFKGNILINGESVLKKSKEIHKTLGYLPQESGFQEWRTVNHALTTFGKLSGVSPGKLNKKIEKILQLVGLFEVKDKKISHLSGGMKQRLLLAQALLHNPELLVLDEPLSGLDPTSRFQVKKIIKLLVKKDITIFFSSHILSDVQDLADRIGIINKGKIMRVGTPDELQSHFQIGNDIEVIYSMDSVPCKGLENLSEVNKVQTHQQNRQIIHLTSDIDIDKSIKKILQCILDEKCKIRNFNLLKPSLEQVYLNYIGENSN
ncbi:MAG: ATP-binding cassette domain-containing protein [Candidatus Lokiarchaeota archaeon]|nr:ATP-binding cassette domain-containing protein [Candidatus Lokiarchaeota archaeon]